MIGLTWRFCSDIFSKYCLLSMVGRIYDANWSWYGDLSLGMYHSGLCRVSYRDVWFRSISTCQGESYYAQNSLYSHRAWSYMLHFWKVAFVRTCIRNQGILAICRMALFCASSNVLLFFLEVVPRVRYVMLDVKRKMHYNHIFNTSKQRISIFRGRPFIMFNLVST